MPLWKSRFTITSGEEKNFPKWDYWSFLLFYLSLQPCFVSLKNVSGFCSNVTGSWRHKISPFFYVDDLKLYYSDLHQGFVVVQEIAHSVRDEQISKSGKSQKRTMWENGEEMQFLDRNILGHSDAGHSNVRECYNPLGDTMKKALCPKYEHLLRKIWSSQQSAKNKISATPVLLYFLRAVKWMIDVFDKST